MKTRNIEDDRCECAMCTLFPEWISINDRLPTKEESKKNSGWFLVYRPMQGRADISRYDGHEDEHSWAHGWKKSIDSFITHWMPLPDVPMENKLESNCEQTRAIRKERKSMIESIRQEIKDFHNRLCKIEAEKK